MEKIPLPDTVAVVHEEGNEATFEIAPYYPGYGPTVGNALRRVLLSSLPGAAITAVHIEGIGHEFSSLPGVAEDVVSVLLNLKRVRLRMESGSPVELRLRASGIREVKAGDIENVTGVEVVNPGHVIAHLTDGKATLDMTMTAQRGRGYVPVEVREREERPIGTIAIDAIYTPVERVSFRVENVRVGQATEYHKLILTVRTDGTLSPREALGQAAAILQDHYGALASDTKERLTYQREQPAGEELAAPAAPPVGVRTEPSVPLEPALPPSEERMVGAPIIGAVRAPEERIHDPRFLPIVELPVSTRIQNILEKEGVRTVAGLLQKTRSQLLGMPGLGEKALEEVEAALVKIGGLELRAERPVE